MQELRFDLWTLDLFTLCLWVDFQATRLPNQKKIGILKGKKNVGK
jgi:hypothetical protein